MNDNTKPHQGKVLEMLIIANGITKTEAAKKMGFNKGYLSSQYSAEKLSEELKGAASELFQIDVSVFDTGLEGLPSPMVKSDAPPDPNAHLTPEEKAALLAKIEEQEKVISVQMKTIAQLAELLYEQGKITREEYDKAQKVFRIGREQ